MLSSSPLAAIASAKFLREAVYMKRVWSGGAPSQVPWGAASGKLRSADCDRLRALVLPTPQQFAYSDQPAHRLLRRARPGVLRMAPTAAEAREWARGYAASRVVLPGKPSVPSGVLL